MLVVIDQWPSWSFAARAPILKDRNGGIGRLLREGAIYPSARYPYAATYTGPGHAALSTGAPPSVSGIIANEWYDGEEGKVIESVSDTGYPMLVVGGWAGELADSGRPRFSPWRLRVGGIADALRASGHGKSVGVSLKNRAAMLATGRHADLAIWYDDAQRAFTTTTWYRKQAPSWLVALAREHPIGPRLIGEWTPLDAALLARTASVPDDAPGEATNTPFGATFPHRPLMLPDPAQAIKMMPLGDTVVLEAALAAVDGEDLGRGDSPDYLEVSFSSHDYVGHEYGQESWEELDELLRLDADLGLLLDGLEARVGRGRVAVVLTSDHGAPRMPAQHPGAIGVDAGDVVRAAEAAMAPFVGGGDSKLVEYGRDPSLYLSARVLELPASERDRALDAAVEAIRKVPGIGYAERTDRIAAHCDDRPPSEGLLCRSIDIERSGQIFFGPRPGSLIVDKEQDPISHGSANDDDLIVPILVWGPGIAPGRHEELVSTLQVAPTLAALLRIAPPDSAKAPPLPVVTQAPAAR